MPVQNINEMLGLPELQIQQILSMDAKEIYLAAATNRVRFGICRVGPTIPKNVINNPLMIRLFLSAANWVLNETESCPSNLGTEVTIPIIANIAKIEMKINTECHPGRRRLRPY
jgi:hypothetical protein